MTVNHQHFSGSGSSERDPQVLEAQSHDSPMRGTFQVPAFMLASLYPFCPFSFVILLIHFFSLFFLLLNISHVQSFMEKKMI